MTQDVINVRDFGAVGDGVTDDTAAIQAAIADAERIKAWIYFPPVKYAYMVKGLTIGQTGTNYTCHFQGGGFDPSGASQPITGQYTGQSMIKLMDGSNTSLITINEDAAQPQFRNITFRGNRAKQDKDVTSYCIYLADTEQPSGRYRYACHMENCFVVGGKTGGIHIGANRGSGYYRNVWVQYCGTKREHVAVNVRCYDQIFEALQVGPNDCTGMYIGAVTQIQMIDSVFFMNNEHLKIGTGAGQCQFTNCVFDQAKKHGVIVQAGSGCGAYGARVFTNCAWYRNSAEKDNRWSDIFCQGDRRLVLIAPAFVGNYGGENLVKHNIEFDPNSYARVIGHMCEQNDGKPYRTAFTNLWSSLAYAGDRTAYLSPWSSPNQLSVVFNDTEKVRFTSKAMALVGVAYCDPRYITPVATNNGTTTMTAMHSNCILVPKKELDAHTVKLPPPQGDGQIVRISSHYKIFKLTVWANKVGTTVLNNEVTLDAGDAIAFLYVEGGKTWARI